MNRSSDGGLPTFLVIGAGKAGTTSMYRYLEQHPEIFMSPVKEPKFFALEGHPLDFKGPGDERFRIDTTTTLESYRRLFRGRRDERVAGEGSVVYLHHPRAAGAIAQHIPDVKLIALLRQPADRAYSAFLHRTRDGVEPFSEFEDALEDEPRRIREGYYFTWHDRDQGFYHRNLLRYFERFDRSQIRVYLYDEFDREPLKVLADVFGFLGVDSGFVPDVRVRHNISGRAKHLGLQRFLTGRHPLKRAMKAVVPEQWGHRLVSMVQPANLERKPLRPELRAELTAGYREDVGKLEALLGRDLSQWHNPVTR